MEGLPEPYAKRTVEGDLGVRHNLDVLLEIGKANGVIFDEEVISSFHSEPSRTPRSEKEFSVDTGLTCIAAETAMERHAGRIQKMWGPMGEMFIQIGKDLSDVSRIVGTGGPIVFSPWPEKILSKALASERNPYILKPKKAGFYIDERYIMYAMGLLAQSNPGKALRIMKKYLSWNPELAA